MGEVVNLRKQQQLDMHNPAVWGIVSAFADDPTRPLPRSDGELAELGLLLGQAKFLLEAAHQRVIEAVKEGVPF